MHTQRTSNTIWLLLAVLAIVTFSLITARAQGQDLALRTSWRTPELRIEAGATLLAEKDFVAGLDARAWVSAGTILENQKLLGSAAALVKFFERGRIFLEAGPAWTGWKEDGEFKSFLDFVVQASARIDPGSALAMSLAPSSRGPVIGLMYSRTF